MDQLRVDLIGYSLDMAIVIETHVKAHHTDPKIGLTDYGLGRRDRVGRQRGAVAVAVKAGMPAAEICIDGDT